MDRVMSWPEIEETFNGEWGLIEDPECNPALQVVRGKVIFHSKERSAVHDKFMELRPFHHAILYAGEFPKDLDFALSPILLPDAEPGTPQ